MANHARVSSQQHYERQAPATLLNAPIRATLLPAPEVAGAGVRLAKAALEAGGRVLDVAAREYERDETTRVEESLLAMRRELSEERDRYMREHQGQDALKAGEHFDGFARDVARRYLSEGKFQGRFAEAFMKQAAGQAIQFTEQGMGYAAREREAWNKSVLDGKVSEFLRDAALDFRNIPRLQEEWRNLKDAVGKMRPGMDNTAYLNDIGRRLAGSVIDGHLAEDDLRGARESVERFRDFLGADANAYAVKIRGQADALQAKAEANRNKAVREILKGERDALYLAERGNVFALEDMTKRLRAVGATEEAEALETQTTAFRESAQVLRSAAELPLPEAMDRLRELDAELDTTLNVQDVDRHRILSSSRDMLARQLSARTNALQKDPAAAAESAAQFQPGQFQLPDDAGMEDRAAARMGWQVKNGVSNPVPLTKHEVENLAEQYEKASSPGDFVAMLSESFGGQSGEVLKQLVTSGKLPPDANLALNMPRESANLLMLMSRKNAVKETESALGVDNAMKQDIAEAVRDELEDILGTLAAQGGSDIAAQVLDSSYKLSLKYMERGMDAKDAGERAAREVMAERYEVRDSYRVPRDYDADSVASGARLWLKELASSGTVVMDVVPGLTEAQTKAKKAAILTGGGRWVNNADESGLLLTVNGRIVLDETGQRIQVKFEDLAAKGESWKKANALSGPARGGSFRTVLTKNK